MSFMAASGMGSSVFPSRYPDGTPPVNRPRVPTPPRRGTAPHFIRPPAAIIAAPPRVDPRGERGFPACPELRRPPRCPRKALFAIPNAHARGVHLLAERRT